MERLILEKLNTDLAAKLMTLQAQKQELEFMVRCYISTLEDFGFKEEALQKQNNLDAILGYGD